MAPPKSGLSRSGTRKPRGSSQSAASNITQSTAAGTDAMRRHQMQTANTELVRDTVYFLCSRQHVEQTQQHEHAHQMQAAQGLSGLAQTQSQPLLHKFPSDTLTRIASPAVQNHQPRGNVLDHSGRIQHYQRLEIQEATTNPHSARHHQFHRNHEGNPEVAFRGQNARRVQEDGSVVERPFTLRGVQINQKREVGHQPHADVQPRTLIGQRDEPFTSQAGSIHSHPAFHTMVNIQPPLLLRETSNPASRWWDQCTAGPRYNLLICVLCGPLCCRYHLLHLGLRPKTDIRHHLKVLLCCTVTCTVASSHLLSRPKSLHVLKSRITGSQTSGKHRTKTTEITVGRVMYAKVSHTPHGLVQYLFIMMLKDHVARVEIVLLVEDAKDLQFHARYRK